MTAKLSEQTIEIVKSTVPVLAEHGNAITKVFYERMLREVPELNNVFNQTNQAIGDQPKALANAVYAAAANIDQLETILPVVKQISHKHKSLMIVPEQYPIVGKYLLLAIKEVLGDAATDDIINAWAEAYDVIADVFIQVEREMYAEDEATAGGWNGFREFIVKKKVPESTVITSFYLEPKDGKQVMNFLPGQYISIKVQLPDSEYTGLRQYSLSTAPGKNGYRISVKKETSSSEFPNGVVSTHLHEQINEGAVVELTAPAGEFYLDMEDTRPLVLMARGVGLTPLMSMLETVITVQPEREVHFLYATYSLDFHSMRDRMLEIAKENPQVKLHTIYNRPVQTDEGKYDFEGYIDEALIRKLIPSNEAAFYFCGPFPFLETIAQGLRAFDVAESDIHYEIFGSQLAQKLI